MKTRVIRRYHPYCGNWWEIRVKILFFWVKCPLVFFSEERAIRARFYELRELFEKPTKTIVTHLTQAALND